jgi:hypothetical protein
MTMAITTAQRLDGTTDDNSDNDSHNNVVCRTSCRRVVVPSWP